MTATDRANESMPLTHSGTAFWCLLVLVLVGSFVLRMRGADQLYRDAETIAFSDLDSQRRLARLEAVAAADRYPVTERRDGFPDGTISHWTRPFDWCLQLLNPFAAAFAGRAKGFEPAAIYAGPVLGVLSVAVFLWAAVRLLGRGPGLLASAFYSLQYPLVLMFGVGNGDHQNLQHLSLLVFAVLWLLTSAGRVGRWAVPVSGVGLGFGLWVSTESMLLMLAWVALAGVAAVVPAWNREGRALADERVRCGAVLLTLALGMYCEQTEFFAFQWDQLSWFQLYPVAVFGLFLLLTCWLRPWLAGLLGLAVGVLLLLVIPGFWAALQAQLADFAVANVWLQNVVAEFRSSFDAGDGLAFTEGARRFTWLLVLLPVLLVAVALAPLSLRARLVLLGSCGATFAMAVHEVKLSHLFAVWYPLVVVIGGLVVRDRWLARPGPARTVASWGFVALLIGLGLAGLPAARLSPQHAISDDVVRELCRFLRQQDGRAAGSVMAPWQMGAPIMYRAGWPVVASGYHRNIQGIHDGYRFFMSQPGEGPVVQEILRRRRVRFVVAWFDRKFMQAGEVVLGDGRVFFARGTYSELATNSLFFRLRYNKAVPGFRLCYVSKDQLRLGSGPPEPFFRVFEVVD